MGEGGGVVFFLCTPLANHTVEEFRPDYPSAIPTVGFVFGLPNRWVAWCVEGDARGLAFLRWLRAGGTTAFPGDRPKKLSIILF